METKLRVLHYLNQFFGGIGGEKEASCPMELRKGAVGPGRALEQMLVRKGRSWRRPSRATITS